MYWYWFSSFIYVYINFQPCLGSAACAGKRSGPSTPHCSDVWQRHPKAGSKHREHKWHFSAQISKALVPAVRVEGRMQVADWGICACSIFRGTCIQIPLSLTALEIHCHTSRFGFGPLFCIGPTFFGRKKPLLWDIRAEWCYLMKQREVGSSKMYFNSTSVSWVHEQSLPSGCMNRVSLLQSCFRLPFFGHSVLAHWRHQLMPQVQLPFLSCTYYRQRQMATWNCWTQLLDHVGTFGFLQGSCILQNSPVHVSWYVILEEASKYKWGFFAAVWRGSARHSKRGVSFFRLHKNKIILGLIWN